MRRLSGCAFVFVALLAVPLIVNRLGACDDQKTTQNNVPCPGTYFTCPASNNTTCEDYAGTIRNPGKWTCITNLKGGTNCRFYASAPCKDDCSCYYDMVKGCIIDPTDCDQWQDGDTYFTQNC